MIDSINSVLEFLIKSLSLLFTIFLFVGASVTWSYLDSSGVGNEISSVISSPQTLLTIAIYSILISVYIVSVVILVPASVDFCVRSPDISWAEDSSKVRFKFHFSLIFFPLLVFFILAVVDFVNEYFIYIYFLMCLFMSFVFYFVYGGPLDAGLKYKVKNFVVVFLAISLAYALLIFSIFLFSRITERFDDVYVQLIILFIALIFYSAFAAIATSYSGYVSYFPVVFVSLIVVFVIFSGTTSGNVVSRLGLGAYESSFAVDEKYVSAIKQGGHYNIEEL